jgi:hypothetical protein
MSIFLALVPLTELERQARVRIVRVVVRADGALMLIFGLIFLRQWWVVAGAWAGVNFALTWVVLRSHQASGEAGRPSVAVEHLRQGSGSGQARPCTCPMTKDGTRDQGADSVGKDKRTHD